MKRIYHISQPGGIAEVDAMAAKVQGLAGSGILEGRATVQVRLEHDDEAIKLALAITAGSWRVTTGHGVHRRVVAEG